MKQSQQEILNGTIRSKTIIITVHKSRIIMKTGKPRSHLTQMSSTKARNKIMITTRITMTIIKLKKITLNHRLVLINMLTGKMISPMIMEHLMRLQILIRSMVDLLRVFLKSKNLFHLCNNSAITSSRLYKISQSRASMTSSLRLKSRSNQLRLSTLLIKLLIC